jgi:RNA polymerase sigma-70 factor (ECF subfamily)
MRRMGEGSITEIRSAHARPSEAELEQYRAELTGYCYRMLGSSFEAEDAVQDAMLRAWRSLDRFEGRSSLRSWLYSIATNVCMDMLNGRQRRARPVDMGPAVEAEAGVGPILPENTWLEPIPDARAFAQEADPAEQAQARESLRLAFVAALQFLPPRQRAVLILREVLRWQASEVAELLDTSVASVNSALQRARAGLEAVGPRQTDVFAPADGDQRRLLDRYVEAFEAYDMDALVALLHEDATLSMPPYDMWLSGRDQMLTWFVGTGVGCRGSRMLPTVANGMPAFGQYRVAEHGDGHEAWALQVLDVSGGRITGITAFLDVEALFPLFGLPMRLG